MKNKAVHLAAISPFGSALLPADIQNSELCRLYMKQVVKRVHSQKKFVFSGTSAIRFTGLKTVDAQLFREIRDIARRDGRISAAGGMLSDPECTVPCTESFIRQMLYGQLYFERNFGEKCRSGLCLFSGAYSPMMPQLLKKAGMARCVITDDSLTNERDPSLFWWESPDGSRILTYAVPSGWMQRDQIDTERELKEMIDEARKRGHSMLFLFDSERSKAATDHLMHVDEVLPEDTVEYSTPDAFFDAATRSLTDFPVRRGAQGQFPERALTNTARALAAAETALYRAELWDTAAARLLNKSSYSRAIAQGWTMLCEVQSPHAFAGTLSSEETSVVHDFIGSAAASARKIEHNALLDLVRNIRTGEPDTDDKQNAGQPVVLFNANLQPVETTVELPDAFTRCLNESGQSVCCAVDAAGHTFITARIPALGYTTYRLYKNAGTVEEVKPALKLGVGTVENRHLKIEFDRKTGVLSKFIKKSTGKNYCCGENFAVPVLVQTAKDGTATSKPFTCDGLKLTEDVHARIQIHASYRGEGAHMTCDYILYPTSDMLHVDCSISLDGAHGQLRLPFPLGGAMGEFTVGSQSCCLKAPADGRPVLAQHWADFSSLDETGTVGGLSLLHAGSGVFSCEDGVLSLTVADTEKIAGDLKQEKFSFAVYPHEGAPDLATITRKADVFHLPPIAVLTDRHPGELPAHCELIRTDQTNIAPLAFKYCEDGSDTLILRLRETAGKERTRAAIMGRPFGFAFYSDFGPFEIKTFRVDSDGHVQDTDFLEDAKTAF